MIHITQKAQGACQTTYEAHKPFATYMLLLLSLLLSLTASAQNISIGGKVYGGGNAGDLLGNTSVTVRAGDLNEVYGGARMADVDGNAFVNIDGDHASDFIIINRVYGGNDISGTIGANETGTKAVPASILTREDNLPDLNDKVDNTWDACVRISTKMDGSAEAADAQKIYIGQLFGAGNGEYNYTTDYSGKSVPELNRTYLEVVGGSIVYAYGGGNNATVNDKTVICVDNPSAVVNSITNASGTELLTNDRFREMGINTGFSYPSSNEFQIGRFFGGNNKAEMAIIPKWNLKSGSIRNLYSGGNEGDMTSSTGILLEIAENSTIKVDNVYGGCRKANVNPKVNGVPVDHVASPTGYSFPQDLAARLLVRGGDINNAYGGNDVSGKVYFGNAVGIYTSIRGDVFGGGNGSYPYTDCEYLENDDVYGDLYYNPTKVIPGKPGASSVEALNAFRPNSEQVSLRLVGTAEKPTIIGGSVYVGGNSATLKKKEGATSYLAELKIGSYVIADSVFLGNNGKNMVTTDSEKDALRLFKRWVKSDGTLVAENVTPGADDKPFNSMTLVGTGNVFAQYMEGCAMNLLPGVVFDNKAKGDPANYDSYTSYFGSFYCGGNVGSITKEGLDSINFNHEVIIYNKLVAGCNNAIVKATPYNAEYIGGIIGEPDPNTGNKMILNLSGLKIEPKRWAIERNGNYEPVLTNGKPTYLLTTGTHPHRYLEWNTVDSREYNAVTKTFKEMAPVTTDIGGLGESSEDDLARRLYGGSIYGGCYTSGVVNGNVIININATLEERDKLFDEVQSDELGEEESLYGNDQNEQTKFNITKRNTGVILAQQGMDVLGASLNVFGGGKGKDTEIWGSTVINLNRGYTFQIFGGSEEGVIGKSVGTSTQSDYVYNSNTGDYSFNGKTYKKNSSYSCYVNLCGTKGGVSKKEDQSESMAECEFMYGGGFFGPICGNTVINMGNGRIFNSFAGSCNGDILGTAETFVGRQVKASYKTAPPINVIENDVFEPGFPWVRDIVYGANDLGGRILGENNYQNRLRGVRSWDTRYSFDVSGKVHNPGNKSVPDVVKASAYVEYLQGRADAIFGGCYGTYKYKDRKFSMYTDANGEPLTFDKDTDSDGKNDPKFFKTRLNNAFVNFRPTYYNNNNVVNKVYGAGQGESGETDRDLMQNRSYVLIDIPQISNDNPENFNKYSNMEVFGAGAWGGVGMNYTYSQTSASGFDLDKASAIIDLMRGNIGAAYGGSLSEGVTRRTVVNVPTGSTINIGSIFGGAYGEDIYKPCDVIEAHVEYHSADAVLVNNRPRVENNVTLGNPLMLGAIYGGNNNMRRTIYGIINIDVPVKQSHYKYGMTTGTVYGAGYGSNTWNDYTQVNLNSGANVFEVYGGGEAGGVMSAESVEKYVHDNPYGKSDEEWKAAWTLGSGYDPDMSNFPTTFDYVGNLATNLENPIVRRAEMDDRTRKTYKYNTNVIINKGAYVGNYAYGGGYGKEEDKFAGSGDVYGTTYIALLGGTVHKDMYAAGTSGSVYDLFGVGAYDAESNPKGFTASANAYVKGGTVRNVYGGGWRGSVGYHQGAISNATANNLDQLAEAHVVIGDTDGTSHLSGIPSVTRNVYGGGEGGAIYGNAYVTLNKGYIGYRYDSTLEDDTETTDINEQYAPELDDVAPGDNKLDLGGNVFGGGYVANSYVDKTHVVMFDGIVRGSLYGGGEIGPVGRGTVHKDTLALAKIAPYIMHNHTGSAQPAAIYKGGETHVTLWGGHVMRDVFGGGRGYDNWNGEGFFQSDEEKNNMDRSSKGYVFGSTDVLIRGGEIGTEEGMLRGFGNVFGGGNEGFVYSATGKKTGTHKTDDQLEKGIPIDGGGFYYKNPVVSNGKLTSSDGLTLDCNITIEPYCQVTDNGGVNIGDKTFAKGSYVPVIELNKLKNRNNEAAAAQWAKLDTRGITIHNALFAGGNITEGSDNLYANTTTVYGNAAASLRDVYNLDLISLGTEDMGGLYGDGNLTLVDGFRELHIDNYGTDYYSLDENMLIDDYNKLTDRQKAYYKLKYVTGADHTFEYYECKELHTYEVKDGETVISSTPYKRGQKITEAEYNAFPAVAEGQTGERSYWTKGHKTFQQEDQIEEGEYVLMYPAEQSLWTLYGVTSIYAGRPLNTIQRADMCGVFGSRMVLKGAEDRAINTIDYHPYTINRVDEVSLNKRTSQAGDTGKDAEHGNYFGIYSEVNYLGNLTSDVFFDDVRKTDTDIDANKADGSTTYYEWKSARPHAKNRNNGTSHNMVALASGVFLEIKRSEGELTGQDDWGYITGIVELDLINVMQGMGGGYVYARNEHGIKTYHGPGSGDQWGKVTMLDYNNNARTYRRFEYTDKAATSSLQEIETSGNFVHNTKQIVDDCYPNGGMYKDQYVASPAHYWFIRGQIYVYEQYISAFTGSANAYAEKVEMPLTISAAANGRMTLREVQPNYYAYYDKNGNKLGDPDPTLNADKTIIVNNTTYKLNDPVSYWAYSLMSDADKARFVEETYVVIDSCKVNGTLHVKGEVLLPSEYNTLKNTTPMVVTYEEGDVWKSDDDHGFDYFFRSSNNLSSNTGYVLTYDVNNPMVWNNYYTEIEAPGQANMLNATEFADGKKMDGTSIDKEDYIKGPTFTPKTGKTAVYAQQTCKFGDIIFARTKTNYDTNVIKHITYEAVPNGEALTEGKTYYTNVNEKYVAHVATGDEVSDGSNYYTNGQAIVTEQAYIVTKEFSVKDDDTGVEVKRLNVGTPIYEKNYTPTQWTAITASSAEPAKVCTTLLEFSPTDYIYAGQLMTAEQVTALKSKVIAKNGYTTDDQGTADAKATTFLNKVFDNAYYCTEEGLYGGSYFEAGVAYSALDTWCSMTADEREHFYFNYDALDLLVDPTYDRNDDGYYDSEEKYGYKPMYDGYDHDDNKLSVGALPTKVYSVQQSIDYQAEFTGLKDEDGTIISNTLTYKDEGNHTITYTASSEPANWLTREQYEDIPNEKHNFSPVTVTAPGYYYVVNNVFMRGDVPYTIGQVIDEASYLSMTPKQRSNVDVYNFTTDHQPNTPTINENGEEVYPAVTFYYCRKPYTVNERGEGVAVTTTAINEESEVTYDIGDDVPQGAIIDQDAYDDLKNFQQGFVIHGTSPTETSTLYVSSESDIHDLSTEKIITVVYLYEYEESDESGLNVVPVSERHIVNIHINFKSGVPEIGEISKPDIVLPGTTIGMNIPTVSQGAYRVTESGWELFDNESDARTHTNGKTYYNNETPVYWYQNGYWIAYYAQTYLGKTYSNSVKIGVANYHDMKKVMDDKEHHYYIDHKDMAYEPKIYINDYSATSENGLDMFKKLIDLSMLDETKVNTDANGLITTIKDTDPAVDSPLKGHALLDNRAKPMRGGEYLEFFMRADQDHSGSAWTSIADNDGECFEGVLHGDGHTISGLSNSLFNHLCGSVYNLGVTGSFNGAGVAETGDGYVENCWIKTSATEAAATKHHAVFGDPSDTKGTQIVNSYYPASNEGLYLTTAHARGNARMMPDKAFYNGEVAYDLNGFYLNKRFYDGTSLASGKQYSYWKANADGTLPTTMTDAYYPDDYAIYPLKGDVGKKALRGYVEERFNDGDFIYADGTIPDSPNERLYTDPDTKEMSYHAIWPDDYIFFGQALNYDYMDGKNGRDLRTHQNLPAVINKSDNRVLTDISSNRIYRAPAYFRSSKMGVTHFNPYAVFAAKKKKFIEASPDTLAYKDMTAIDFTGYNDVNYAYQKGWNKWSKTSQLAQASGMSDEEYAFYPPLLDDGGVKGLYVADLTRNLLAYTMTTTAEAQQTDITVNAYLHDEQYRETETAPVSDLYADTYRYHTVAERDTHADDVRGHHVQKQADGSFVANTDHILIDRQDFNAPISYSFADGQRMWYQRVPDHYAGQYTTKDGQGRDVVTYDFKAGWEGISLPFKAEIVTTDVKGEITHFYNNSGKNDSGHEYWLREFTGGVTPKAGESGVYTANFLYPDANSTDGDKIYTNTFLWDYYYSHNNIKRTDGNTTGEDMNSDEYQESDANRTYYKKYHTYDKYPRMDGAKPYIIGFPGQRYYEFDLSGNFEAMTAYSLVPEILHPDKLDAQTITFASKPGETVIEVSDNAASVKYGDYSFVPCYLNSPDVTTDNHAFLLNSRGNGYVENLTATTAAVSAFRPYFEAPAVRTARGITRSIVFSDNTNDDLHGILENGNGYDTGKLTFSTGRKTIIATSTLRQEAPVTIHTTSGVVVAAFNIQPGETIETQVNQAGVYIVNNKKVTVK